MSLLVSLGRETQDFDVGAHDAVVLRFDELRGPGGEISLARHRNNRWVVDQAEFARLDIAGPLMLTALPDGREFGPYQHFSMVDGVAYVDRRVFAFTDLEQKDWYVHDAGKHGEALMIRFHRTGP